MKKWFVICLCFFCYFININTASAIKCSDINNEINKYNQIENKLSKVDCSKTSDSKIVNKCNKLNLKKSNSISTLYRMKTQKPNCSSAIDKVDTIIDKNKKNCSLISDGLIEKFSNVIMTVFYIISPILVILMSSLDYTKAIMSNDAQNALKNTSTRFIKRIVILILIFLSPAIVNIVLGINNSNYLLNGDGYSCKADYISLKKTFTIKYDGSGDVSGTSGGSSYRKNGGLKSRSSSGLIAGDYDGYQIRVSTPTMSAADTRFYIPSESNTGQCVWYVKGRAREILTLTNIETSKRKRALSAIESTMSNAKDWWPRRNDSLAMFGSSNNIENPKPGAIIVFNSCSGHPYGHVAMVEKVYKNDSGKVTAIDYTEGWTNTGSCPNTKMSCVNFKYNQKVSLSNVKVNSSGEPFLGYIYLLD